MVLPGFWKITNLLFGSSSICTVRRYGDGRTSLEEFLQNYWATDGMGSTHLVFAATGSSWLMNWPPPTHGTCWRWLAEHAGGAINPKSELHKDGSSFEFGQSSFSGLCSGWHGRGMINW